MAFDYGFGTDLFDKGVTHIRKSCLPIGAQLLLHFGYTVLNHVQLVFRKLQRLADDLITFH